MPAVSNSLSLLDNSAGDMRGNPRRRSLKRDVPLRSSLSSISVHLKLNYDTSAALTQIQAKVAQVRNDLPPESEAPEIELETAEHERDILRTNTQTLAMMLRKCAHRLKCNGHEDLSADVVGLLRRYGLLGSPLRGTEPEHG